MSSSRHRSRELAVQLSYQWELDRKSLSDPKVLDRFWNEQALSNDENRIYFERLVKGIAEFLPQIDSCIERVSQNWKLSRIEKIDLAVLRVGVFELIFGQASEKIDIAVIINEAVELAKRFGTKESPGFVNGVLDALAKEAN